MVRFYITLKNLLGAWRNVAISNRQRKFQDCKNIRKKFICIQKNRRTRFIWKKKFSYLYYKHFFYLIILACKINILTCSIWLISFKIVSLRDSFKYFSMTKKLTKNSQKNLSNIEIGQVKMNSLIFLNTFEFFQNFFNFRKYHYRKKSKLPYIRIRITVKLLV